MHVEVQRKERLTFAVMLNFRHPELVSGSCYRQRRSKMLKQVQHDDAGQSLRPLRETSSLVKLVANVTILTLAAMNDRTLS